MRRCTQQQHLQRAIKRKRENALRRSRLGVLARERKRMENPIERAPKFARFYPLQLGVRDKITGDEAWVDFKSVRDATRRIGMAQKFYVAGKGKQ